MNTIRPCFSDLIIIFAITVKMNRRKDIMIVMSNVIPVISPINTSSVLLRQNVPNDNVESKYSIEPIKIVSDVCFT